jgi:hypothetical protein
MCKTLSLSWKVDDDRSTVLEIGFCSTHKTKTGYSMFYHGDFCECIIEYDGTVDEICKEIRRFEAKMTFPLKIEIIDSPFTDGILYHLLTAEEVVDITILKPKCSVDKIIRSLMVRF